MAEESTPQNNGAVTNTFNKGMQKDFNETFIGDGLYTHARNAVNNSHDGQVGVLGNEPANLFCVNLPYTLIGCIHLTDDKWAIFTTDNTNSEIGVFDESACSYAALRTKEGNHSIDFNCLKFNTTNLITGTSRKRYDCERIVYFDDGLNPSRAIDFDNPPVLETCTTVAGCTQCLPTITNGKATLDCEKIRLALLVKHPCITIKRGEVAGTLLNGSYQACIAYTEAGVKLTDYMGLTEVQGLFTHENVSSSLEINITDIDERYDEFELVIVFNVNSQTTARKIGTYSISQGTIYVDRIETDSPVVPLSSIVLNAEPIERTDAMYAVNDYLIRTGVYSKFKFNYQPLANQILTEWVAVEYPADYYIKSNNNVGYLRDEQYAFFIRFVYNTGEYSDSYHIPGRPPVPGVDDQIVIGGDDIFETGGIPTWQAYNTASASAATGTLADGGVIIARGQMGYWESTERYPDKQPNIWNSFPNTVGHQLNLCGKPIRHHKFPDETVDIQKLKTYNNLNNTIRLLGVEFSNILQPRDENGAVITSIVGYEILRGSREGNKSILAKGMLNNMREYTPPNNPPNTIGLYPNYPFNDLGTDNFLTSTPQINGLLPTGFAVPLTKYRKDIFTFHSPETTFSNPFLSVYDLKIYDQRYGNSYGYFENPYKHPQMKFLSGLSRQLANFVSGLVTAFAAVSTLGGSVPQFSFVGDSDIPLSFSPSFEFRQDRYMGYGKPILFAGPAGATTPGLGDGEYFYNSGSALPPYSWDPTPYGVTTGVSGVNQRNGVNQTIALANKATYVGLALFMFQSTREQIYRLMYALIPKRQYAAQYNSHGFYDQSARYIDNNRRRKILEINYVGNNLQQFVVPTSPISQFQINNLNRNKTVVLAVNKDVYNPTIQTDNSRIRLSDVSVGLTESVTRNIASHYGAIRIPVPSQYGQLDSIKQIPITDCIVNRNANGTFPNSSVLFRGDTYLNRFTEKNTMFFFTAWLMGEPDLFEYDYTRYNSIAYPVYWVNSQPLKGNLFSQLDDVFSLDRSSTFDVSDFLTVGSLFYVKPGYFYLFNSGVRDFFVESEVNLAFRDWEDDLGKRHYDPYRFTDLSTMFRSDIISGGNYYKYDYSLSVSKIVTSRISWSTILPRDYDPDVYSTCYKYRPNRVIYSLPQQDESKKDSWRIFLINNYKDFGGNVTCIKPINKNGALFMMRYMSPVQFLGVDQLQTDAGTKVTIGDGGLFSQPFQSIVNSDESYEYGSNQGRFCSLNTTYGVFWVSQNQGKVFNLAGGGLNDITNEGLKWWFAKYLPSQLLKVYPEFKLGDNSVAGVGVQMIYDNTNDIVYITKKDYKPKFGPTTGLTLDPDGITFRYNNTVTPLTDTNVFEPANFTISYDPKLKAWISFHDWIPTFMIPGRNHFMTVSKQGTALNDSIWKHNERCDLFTNYYGTNHPFEVEFVASTGQMVNSMRNLEYMLEVYNYYNDCRDKFHVLDQNFDQAIVYNSEQISGNLLLTLKDKTNPFNMLNYPIINPAAQTITINFSKEENKYRFNQFWDITNNRGEFGGGNLPMFITDPGGYKFNINPAYVNYSKDPLQRKKFRHYVNRVFLRKSSSGNNKMLFKISNEKLLPSPR